MESPRPTPHPLILAAAVSVTLLSLTGIAALTGLLPARGTTPEAAPAPVSAPALAAAPAAEPRSPATIQLPPGARITVDPRPAPAEPARPAPPRRIADEAPRAHAEEDIADAPRNARVLSTRDLRPVRDEPARGDDPRWRDDPRAYPDNGIVVERAPTPRACADCAVIESVREVASPGQGSGLGAVAGGVLGGLVGKQFGKGNGSKALAVAGAIGGAYAGHEAEKALRGTREQEVLLRFEDGSLRALRVPAAQDWRPGDPVRLSGGGLVPR